MCGIVGVVNLRDAAPPTVAIARQMLGMIRHRGPDEFGIYHDDRAVLGNARLSIIDLQGGQQPIGNEDGSLWIVFNGEIFNYLELRPHLTAKGHRFQTDCDTEVILHLYEEYGADCLNYLNGQFAIAIWDNRKRRLFLARDRVGIRPLFYTVQNGQLIFGSEIKAILAHPATTASIDPTALAQVFTFWSALGEQTIFQGIYSLPPAHYLELEVSDLKPQVEAGALKAGQLPTQAYWHLDFTECSDRRTAHDYVEEFQSLLLDATRLRLRADVPVGAYLSGGLDSSTTTALIRQYTDTPLDTFSIAFSDPEFDESSFQRQMADRLGTDHQVVYCTPEDIATVFPQVIWHLETPTLRTAAAPMFLLSQLVQQQDLKVVLTGEGADEFLGGYDIFKEMAIRRFWARQPDSQLRPLLLRRLYPEIARLGHTNETFLRGFFRKDLTATDSPFYSHRLRWSNGNRLQRLLRYPPVAPLSQQMVAAVSLPEHFWSWSTLSQAQYLEITTFLSPYLLSSQSDRVAMAHSVEGRFPFLDYRVMEFCNQIPARLKLRGLTEKWLLRQVARDLLPAEIWQRRKRPYRAPIHRSFFQPAMPEYVAELLSESAIRESELFNPAAVAQLVRKASQGDSLSEVDEMAIAGVLSSQLLHHQFVKQFHVRREALRTCDRVKVVTATTPSPIAQEVLA